MWTAYLVTSQDRVVEGQFNRLVQSLELSKVQLIVGCRGFEGSKLSLEGVHCVDLPEIISLSSARNELLAIFPPSTQRFAFFPDDDCWLAPGTLGVAEHWLTDYNFVVGVVDTDLTEYARVGIGIPLDLKLALQKTASAALFFRGDSLENFAFDTRLGLGAKYKAGEDLDLVLSRLIKGQKGVWSPDLRVGHPKKARAMEYFPGSIAALKTNSRYHPNLKFLAFRRLVHGIVFTTTGKLDLRGFILGLKAFLLKAK